MSKSTAQYGNESIVALKGADRVRKRPGVIFGSDGIDGCEHAAFEILSNAIDEAREGNGSLITLTYYEDKSIEVEDSGRGCPVDWNPIEKRYNWELVFCELYAGGKYKNSDGGDYEYSLGLNGLGTCATQYSSEYMDVTVWRDGNKYQLHFKKGKVCGKKGQELITEPADRKKTGTLIRWRPDIEVFTDIDIPEEHFANMLHRQAVVNAGVTFRLRIQKNGKFETRDFLYENGIKDYVAELAGENPLTQPEFISAERKGRDREDKPEYKVKLSAAFCFSTQTSYENQTKKAINNKFIQTAMTEFFKERLEIYFIENKPEADRVAEQVLINKRSRETAERARIGMKKKLSGNIDIANRVQKFVDCRSREPERREIYIVEGDSALGACKLSRDAEFQGIMPVRGKILNCLKADYVRIFKSDVITDLMKVLGCGVEVKDKHTKELSSFDINTLRWSKVIICTDADVDGFQIRTLILTMLYRLVPTLIREGYVYIAESPLYEIESKGKTYFAYSDREKAEIIDSLKGAKASISRSKGLGENDPDMMWMTTMNPETRRLIRVMPEDAELMAKSFDLLLGDDLAGRKEHIALEGHKYLDMADLS